MEINLLLATTTRVAVLRIAATGALVVCIVIAVDPLCGFLVRLQPRQLSPVLLRGFPVFVAPTAPLAQNIEECEPDRQSLRDDLDEVHDKLVECFLAALVDSFHDVE
mmetsp:Transcript_42986/g.56869  ORF Transcript_42986/g.56869 Transcript_42986/m.56869 type:complete len:107 (+) Transcript_42986:160-480(+)